MSKNDVLQALESLEKNSKKRKFEQTIELLINFKGINPAKPQNQVDVKVDFPHATGKSSGRALLYAKTPEFVDNVKDQFSKVIMEGQIASLSKKDKAEIFTFDVSLAEGPVMVTVAKHLGQELAPKGKMPKPVQQSAVQVKEMLSTMKSAVRITNKKGKGIPLVQVVLGKESLGAEALSENALVAIKAVTEALPRKKENIKSIFVKKTMSSAVRVGEPSG